MARRIHSRLKIVGELTAETPLHVGGYGESFETDMALARNGKGEYYIPGTSLTGALRNWFEKSFIDQTDKQTEESTQKFVKDVWGYQDGNEGHASFVLIEDLALPEQVQSELRDGVGIDRFYGTAADGIKFDRAILPKGTRLKFEMTVEIQKDAKKIKAMFGHLLDALSKGNIRLGASKTRGLGKVTFAPRLIKEALFDEFSAILDVVEKKPGKTYQIQSLQNEDTGITVSGSQLLTITIAWKPKSALMVKAGYEGIGVDMLPLTSANSTGKVSLCLPGSSVKGAFRAHAERILRTFSQQTVKDVPFHEEIKLDLTNELFGAKKEENEKNKFLGLGALSVDDCYATEVFDSSVWSEVEAGELEDDKTYNTQTLWQALKKIDKDDKDDTSNFKISHHVAIDRWTGGASEGALYSVLQPTVKIGWQDICLTLDLARLPDDKKLPSLMLLLLVLRDFAENRLPLGFATNRGMGEVEGVSYKTEGPYEIEWRDGKFDFTNCSDLKSALEKEWSEWLKKN